MKVLMINTVCGFGSTGSICVDIANQLTKRGDECYIAYGQGTTDYSKSYKIGTTIENHLHNIGSRALGKQGYFTKRGTNRLISFIKEYNPHVIHLHNLHGNYLNLEILFDFLKTYRVQIVWTLHDCWAFTGKCVHYTDVGCHKWQIQCNKCPQVRKYPPSLFFDKSREMFVDKKKWFGSIKDLTIIPVSHWLAKEVKKSFFKNRPIQMVYNWINTEVFKPYSKEKFNNQYGLDVNKFTIILVSAAWVPDTVKWKDMQALTHMLDDSYQVVLVGKSRYRDRLPQNCIVIDYIHGSNKLAELYSFADVYVHLSTEDTFGKVIAEALSCGTPAIVYNSTACPEIIGENCGYIIERRDVSGVREAIDKVRGKNKNFYSTYCRNHVLNLFDYQTNICKIIKIYKKLSSTC